MIVESSQSPHVTIATTHTRHSNLKPTMSTPPVIMFALVIAPLLLSISNQVDAAAASWRQQSKIASSGKVPRNSWPGYHNPAPISEIKSKVRSSSTVDVAIVGAGYSGLVAARELAREGYKVAVVRGHAIDREKNPRHMFSWMAAWALERAWVCPAHQGRCCKGTYPSQSHPMA